MLTRGRWHRVSALHLLIVAGIAIYVVAVILPSVLMVVNSFTNQSPLRVQRSFIGLSNYLEMAGSERFWRSIWVTVLLTVALIIGSNVIGLALAVTLNHTARMYQALRTIVFLPFVLSAVIVSFIWKGILSTNGILNSVLDQVGLIDDRIPWLGLPGLALASIAVVATWQMIAFTSVVYLAALQNVPREVLEAADVDGASPWVRFRKIVLPLIGPGLTVNIVVTMTTGLRLFDYVVVLTGGGPGGSTESAMSNVLHEAFTINRIGYASALGTFMLLLVGTLAVVSITLLRRREVQL